MIDGWRLACPACGGALAVAADGDGARAAPAPPGSVATDRSAACARCGAGWPARDGIWHLLRPSDAARLAPFVAQYNAVRAAEGRAALGPAERFALPLGLPSAPLAWQWRIRAASYGVLARRGLADRAPGRLVDVGAGNGWLAWRLAVGGWSVLAVDVSDDPGDGLAAAGPYLADLTARGHADRLVRAVAHADRLPLEDGAADAVVLGASLHYTPDPAVTLAEAARVVGPAGRIVVVDSPIYRRRADGERMVAERRAAYTARYGWPSTAQGGREYLVEGELEALLGAAGFAVRSHRPWAGWRWALRPWLARLRGRRAPARFTVTVATRRPPPRGSP